MLGRISDADPTPLRVVIVTLDNHLSGVVDRARTTLTRELPGLTLSMHAAANWGDDDAAVNRCRADIGKADIVIVTMIFLDEQIRAIRPALEARRDACDAMICCMCEGQITKLTRMGKFKMGGTQGGALSFLKKLRGKPGDHSASAGARQMKMLRRLPQILKFMPGTAQDLRAYFLSLQYWLAGSDENVANMVRMLVDRYARRERAAALRGALKVRPPIDYPDVGVYHPAMAGRLGDARREARRPPPAAGAGPRRPPGHAVLPARRQRRATMTASIAALEKRGLDVVPAFASGLDARPAIDRYFIEERPADDRRTGVAHRLLAGRRTRLQRLARSAEEVLAALDVPYVAAHPSEFQTLVEWGASTIAA
jgi:magnesium chelatase subunit H